MTKDPLFLGRPMRLLDLEDVARRRRAMELAPETRETVRRARSVVENLDRGDSHRHVYNVNTNFRALSEMHISPSNVQTLQHNLLRSHACGIDPDLSPHEI